MPTWFGIRGQPRPADEVALRRAVRTGRVPDDHRLHGMLPAHLAWLRRGTWYALAAGLPLFAGLALIALLGTDDIRWAITYLLGAALFIGLSTRTLTRIRRLERQLATAGQNG